MIELHRGICRTVLLIGPWAIKVPTTRPYGRRGDRLWAWTRGVQGNQSERDWSGVAGVAPVLHSWLGGIVQVYPRCDPWGQTDHEPPYDKIGESWMARDRKPENVGWLGGELVWLDYDASWNGCPHSRDVAVLADDEPSWPVP
jgi:hypothetical protein